MHQSRQQQQKPRWQASSTLIGQVLEQENPGKLEIQEVE
jgi:hypothetical protein